VASNQLGYAAKGEHRGGRASGRSIDVGSRCHPAMVLELRADG
jgi:hypothetical protein